MIKLFQYSFDIIRYVVIDYWEENADPRVAHYPIIGNGPSIILSIVTIYLLFANYLGPWFMKNRPAYELKKPMLFYNFCMVLVNLYFSIYFLKQTDNGRLFLSRKFPDRNDTSANVKQELNILYICFLSRFLDFIETIFFVLRKKTKQITFPHLYHHSFVPTIGWMAVKTVPQVPVIKLFLIVNTLIHSMMYLYYAVTTFGPQYQKYLWWKGYITKMQLVHLSTCFLYCIFILIPQEQFPTGLLWFGMAQNIFFIKMYYDYYRKTNKKQN